MLQLLALAAPNSFSIDNFNIFSGKFINSVKLIKLLNKIKINLLERIMKYYYDIMKFLKT